ncbi:MAG TPA: nicotinamide-nucleotide amidohydrolase family protein, partial [Chloroflexota bacterium]
MPEVEALAAALEAHHYNLAVAESCTGGGLAAAITDLAGSSSFFVGGVVAYSNDLKEQLLGVPSATLQQHGAVSEETARAMAEGIRFRTGSAMG